MVFNTPPTTYLTYPVAVKARDNTASNNPASGAGMNNSPTGIPGATKLIVEGQLNPADITAINTPLTKTLVTIPAAARLVNVYLDTLITWSGTGLLGKINVQLGDGTTVNKFVSTQNVLSQGRIIPTLSGAQVVAIAGPFSADLALTLTVQASANTGAVNAGASRVIVEFY